MSGDIKCWFGPELTRSHRRGKELKKEVCTAMLDRYLQSAPTITERLVFPWVVEKNDKWNGRGAPFLKRASEGKRCH